MLGARQTGGFTLIELILVIAIMGILLTVSTPLFIGALQQHQLRAGTKAIVTAGRHAMSLAVISQREVDLTFDLTNAIVRISVVPLRKSPGLNETGFEIEGALPGAVPPEDDALTAEPPPEAVDGGTNTADDAGSPLDEEFEQRLEGVVIESVEVDADMGLSRSKSRRAAQESTVVTIRYYSNGRCQPYRVRLRDEDGAASIIEVDALSAVEIDTQRGDP